ncbi:MAG: hypothetical protein ACKOB4_04115, partial [Acidobacteriota bacterium]
MIGRIDGGKMKELSDTLKSRIQLIIGVSILISLLLAISPRLVRANDHTSTPGQDKIDRVESYLSAQNDAIVNLKKRIRLQFNKLTDSISKSANATTLSWIINSTFVQGLSNRAASSGSKSVL